MFLSSSLQASAFMGKTYSDNLHSVKNTGQDLTMKQMFDISEKLITEQSDEIYEMSTTNWEHSSWKYLSLVGDEQVISLSRAKGLRIFRFCVMSWKGEREPKVKHCMRSKVHRKTEPWIELMVSQLNSSGISSQDLPHWSSAPKSKSSCQKLAKSRKNLQDGSSLCRCSTTSHGDLQTMNRNAN